MGGCILYKVQSFIGSGEVVFLCMSIHAPPIKSPSASQLKFRLKRSTIQVARKHFILVLILMTIIVNVLTTLSSQLANKLVKDKVYGSNKV